MPPPIEPIISIMRVMPSITSPLPIRRAIAIMLVIASDARGDCMNSCIGLIPSSVMPAAGIIWAHETLGSGRQVSDAFSAAIAAAPSSSGAPTPIINARVIAFFIEFLHHVASHPGHRSGQSWDKFTLSLCRSYTACSEVVIDSEHIQIGEPANTVSLQKNEEWNALVDLIQSGRLGRIDARRGGGRPGGDGLRPRPLDAFARTYLARLGQGEDSRDALLDRGHVAPRDDRRIGGLTGNASPTLTDAARRTKSDHPADHGR